MLGSLTRQHNCGVCQGLGVRGSERCYQRAQSFRYAQVGPRDLWHSIEPRDSSTVR